MTSERRNIILITVDDLRADHLGCLGYHRKTSPNIDQVAREGTLFRQAVSNGANTPCSFTSILTSSYALTNTLGNEIGYRPDWIFLSKENITIAEILKSNGYSTAAFHSNPWLSSFFCYNRGFDFFEDSFKGSLTESFLLKEVSLKYKVLEYFRLVKTLYDKMRNRRSRTCVEALNQTAISWLRQRTAEPFFLWLHYMDAHTPLFPPDLSFLERLTAIRLHWKHTRTSESFSREELGKLMDFYDREIMHVDQEIGIFLGELEEIGISDENTYIIIASDHGEQFMDHGRVGHGVLYDEVLRVPLIFGGPEIKTDTAIDSQVSLLDLSPTIIELLGINEVQSFQGTSLLPVMRGESNKEKGVFSEAISRRGRKDLSFRTEKWKYIMGFNGEKKSELYNLERDPNETENLTEREHEELKKFETAILNHLRKEKIMRRTADEKRAIKRALKRLRIKTVRAPDPINISEVYRHPVLHDA